MSERPGHCVWTEEVYPHIIRCAEPCTDPCDKFAGGLFSRSLSSIGVREVPKWLTVLIRTAKEVVDDSEGAMAYLWTHTRTPESYDRIRDALTVVAGLDETLVEWVPIGEALGEEGPDESDVRETWTCPSCGGDQDVGHREGCKQTAPIAVAVHPLEDEGPEPWEIDVEAEEARREAERLGETREREGPR